MMCPRCGGRMIQLTQTGALVCAQNCGESLRNMAKRAALEEWNAKMARRLKAEVPDGVGFCLIAFDFGSDGVITYTGNGRREDMMHAMRELADRGLASLPQDANRPPPAVSTEDCPCCDAAADDLDRSMVQAFLGGVFAGATQRPLGASLCVKHGALAVQMLLAIQAKGAKAQS